MMPKLRYFVIGVTVTLIALFLFKSCKKEEVKVTTKVTTITKTDTVFSEKINTKYKKVFVEKVVNQKGDTTIVYVDKPSDVSIIARVYNQKLKGESASADLEITTTGELLDVRGTISYPHTVVETTIEKRVDKSQLFLGGVYQTNNTLEANVDWNIKNKALVKGVVGYDMNVKTPYYGVGISIPLF